MLAKTSKRQPPGLPGSHPEVRSLAEEKTISKHVLDGRTYL